MTVYIHFFAQIKSSHLRVILNRNILDPCPLMTVQKFASHPGNFFLNKFYQLCMDIDPVSSHKQQYVLPTAKNRWMLGKKWITSINLSLTVLN